MKLGLLFFFALFLLINKNNAQVTTRLTVKENFQSMPIDSLLLWVYPETGRGFSVAKFTVEISAKNKWESKSRIDDNTWPEKLSSIITGMKSLPDFALTFTSIEIKTHDGTKINLPPFIVTFDAQAPYPAKGDIIKTKADWLKNKTPENKSSELRGKLLINRKNTIIPLINGVLEIHSNNKMINTCKTNQYGDFEVSIPSIKEPYQLIIPKNQPSVDAQDKIILAKQNGTVIKEFIRSNDGSFKYELLPTDAAMLTPQEEEDPLLNLDKLVKRNVNKEISVIKSIPFDAASADIKEESKADLDKVAAWMKANITYKLNVLGYTDSKGEADYNLKLSEKRVQTILDYLTKQGVVINRMKGKGMGETKILNRCTDGVDCSEIEHALNRRVEFIFIK